MESTVKLPLTAVDLLQILPHRYPFLLVDKVIAFEDGKGATGIKNVTSNEQFFQGHFPGQPIMPGVLIVEALAQMGVIYAKLSSAAPKDIVPLVVFSGCESLRFRRQVVPGDTLRLEVEFIRRKIVHWKIRGTAYVEDSVAVEGVLTATEIRF